MDGLTKTCMIVSTISLVLLAADTWLWTLIDLSDHEPAANTNRGFSLIVGGFIEKQLAYQYLDRISNDWAPEAFLARYNDKYYVVHSIHSTRSEADMAKAMVNNKGNRAWILRSALRKL